MIPNSGCDPNINIIKIGAYLLSILKRNPCNTIKLIDNCANDLAISVDHVILSLDWLYTISAININEDEILINPVGNPPALPG
jgi:hypothetical protein